MNKFDKYKIPIFISLNILVLISLFGMAYAYFKATINNAESASTISVESGELTINYQGNTANIVASGIVPGWSETKKFTLSGKNTTKTNEFHTDNNLYYKIILAIDNNTFSEGALTYSLAKDSASSTNGKMADEASGTINKSGNQIIGYGYFSETSTFVDHIYNLTISFPSTEYEQSADNGKLFAAHVTIEENKVPTPTTFAKDSWSTIASVVKDGKLDVYPVGSEKEVEIDMNDDGIKESYTVRIANNSHYYSETANENECKDNDGNALASQTACGFVVEFVDIITKYNMNPAGTYNGTEYPKGTNLGGWPASAMYKYLNGIKNDGSWDRTNTIYSKLPSDLRSVIIDTYTVSGHGNSDTGTREDGNFESTDKLYLLTAGEVWGDCLTSNCWDTASHPYEGSGATTTRQLDYYQSIGVSTSSYSGAIKQKHGNNTSWWLRGVSPISNNYFSYASYNGVHGGYISSSTYGLAPAFRIG